MRIFFLHPSCTALNITPRIADLELIAESQVAGPITSPGASRMRRCQRLLAPGLSLSHHFATLRRFWRRWFGYWRVFDGREALARRRSIRLALEGLEERVVPASAQEALAPPALQSAAA